MEAPGALDSFLGRLTSILVNEAQLLGRIRSDVEFIKEEMECMNSLILQLTEAQFRDHLVRAWMKQVVGLTRDCEGNVELYINYVGSGPGGGDGLIGFLRRIPRFLRTICARHLIATRIRELKVRAQDIGDRRQRYGVTVPASTMADMKAADAEVSEEDHRWRAVLLDAPAELPQAPAKDDVVRRGIDSLVKLLSWEPATEDGAPAPHVRVFSILGAQMAKDIAEAVYNQHLSVASIFSCTAWAWASSATDVERVLGRILDKVGRLQPDQFEEEDKVKQLISKIQGCLYGKRFLIRLDIECPNGGECKPILDALVLAADGSLPGSAIIMTTTDYDLALSSYPYKIIKAWEDDESFRRKKVHEFYNETLGEIYNELFGEQDSIFAHEIYNELFGEQDSIFALKTFLHLQYVNPNRREDEVQNYKNAISECRRLKRSIPKQVLLWCYSELPSKYRSCLLYLTIFLEGHVIRTTSLARRWVAEGLITATTSSTTTAVDETRSSAEEAERYLDVLFIRGFVSPVEVRATGNIKSFTVHREVLEFIARVATDVNFMDSNQPPHVARYLSIHNRLSLQISHSDSDNKDITTYLPSLAASSQWQLMKVLDLEGCKGLNKKHMKSICKILLLKYLSLRNTDITELPKQIKELQCLETLDIRQTKVQMLAKKAIVLPLLKHFLAGHKISDSNGTRISGESVSAVELPLGIHKMKNMEILSHVKVTDSDSELTSIAQLLKLRKLGVALHGKSAKLSDLLCQIEKMHRCLRALSIWIDPLDCPDDHGAGTGDALPSLPQFIERLNICCIRNGISSLVQEDHQLTKITLSGTNFKDGDLRLLGRLRELRCLRLQHNSYPDSELAFREQEFKSLKYLVVKGSSITKISFVEEAAPHLERIVLSFDRIGAFSGIKHLHWLMELEFNGERIVNRYS